MTTDGRQRRRLTATVTDLEVTKQKALLVSVELPSMTSDDVERSIEELGRLTDTAGSVPVAAEVLKRPSPDPATFIGSGQAAELAGMGHALDVDVVVFDNDLTPAQQRNLQHIFGCDVVDRVALILDIFAQHATSREGMLQVELALLRYHLPRLRGKGTELSRQAAGIGTRGPGETKLETDRRRIQNRISKLTRELKDLRGTRETQRKARKRSNLPLVALVGYTNAGKSTLLNRLTSADVLTEDRLFSTLGSVVRRTELTQGETILMSDTVGFVRRLPHELIEAFRSTLEEILEADLLLHVVDASDPAVESQLLAVREVLAEIGAGQLDELIVLNKQDLADPVAFQRLLAVHPAAVGVSALAGTGLESLQETIVERLRGQTVELELFVPYDQPQQLASLHRDTEVLKEAHGSEGTQLIVRVHETRAGDYDWAIPPDHQG